MLKCWKREHHVFRRAQKTVIAIVATKAHLVPLGALQQPTLFNATYTSGLSSHSSRNSEQRSSTSAGIAPYEPWLTRHSGPL